MAVRDAFKDDAYEMLGMDGDIQSVDLTVWPWNRATIADGQWLQDHAIGPLSARDLYLADCIESANDSLNTIEGILQTIGVSTAGSGSTNLGYNTKSVHTLICGIDQLTTQSGWSEKSIALVPSDVSDSACAPGSISYLTFDTTCDTNSRAGLPLAGSQAGAVMQANMYNKEAYQLAFTPDGLYYRHLEGNATTAMDGGTQNSYSYTTNPQAFSSLPLFNTSQAGKFLVNVADGKATLTAATTADIAGMNNFYTKSETSGKDQITTEFDKYYKKTDTSGKTELSTEFAKYYTKTETSSTSELSTEFAKYLTAVNATGLLAGQGTSNDALRFVVPQDAGDYVLHYESNTLSWTPAPTETFTQVTTDNTLSGNGTAGNALGLATNAVANTNITLVTGPDQSQTEVKVVSAWLQDLYNMITGAQQ